MTKILSLDPGESTGWVFRDENGMLRGGTIGKNHAGVARLMTEVKPEHVVLERFNLYPGMAKSLSWNSFYPCEVIGVIKLICMQYNISMTEQAPGVKKFFGGFQDDWIQICQGAHTEHTKDAYMHYRYFLLNTGKKLGLA